MLKNIFLKKNGLLFWGCLLWNACSQPTHIEPQPDKKASSKRFSIPNDLAIMCKLTQYNDVRFGYTGLELSSITIGYNVITVSTHANYIYLISSTSHYVLEKDANGDITRGNIYYLMDGDFQYAGSLYCTFNTSHQLMTYYRPAYMGVGAYTSLYYDPDGNLRRAYRGRNGDPGYLYYLFNATSYDSERTPWSTNQLLQWLAATGLLGFEDLNAYGYHNITSQNYYQNPGAYYRPELFLVGNFPITYPGGYTRGRPLIRVESYTTGSGSSYTHADTFDYYCSLLGQ